MTDGTFDATPSADAIMDARNVLHQQVRNLNEREAAKPWPKMEDDPLIARAAGSGINIGPVTKPVKQAFDALLTACEALDDALLALEVYAPQHAERIAKIREARLARSS